MITKMKQTTLEKTNKFFGVASRFGCPKNWFSESNRWKHFVGGAVLALFGTFFCSLGAAGGMEFKDVQWSGSWKNWDWLDFLATILGGLLGEGLQILIIWQIWM